MLFRFTLFLFCMLWPAVVLAAEPLLLGSSFSSPQLTEFTSLLEKRLQRPVQWQEVADPSPQLDLLLSSAPPSSDEAKHGSFVAMVPFADGQIAYLYRLPKCRVGKQDLQQPIAEWGRSYRPEPAVSVLKSVSEAVAAARHGEFSQALTFLYRYLERNHRDARAHADTLVVLEWAKRHREAFELALSRPDLDLPIYALKSVVRSARAVAAFADAEDFLAFGMEQAPNDPELLSLQIHLLADQQRIAEALSLAERALQQHPQYADLWLAKYYLHVLQRDSYAALDAIQRAYALVPSRYARRELIFSLERAGMPHQALQLLQDDPELLAGDERFRLRRASNALQVRWGVYEQPSLTQHYSETDTALQVNEQLLSELDTPDSGQYEAHRRGLLFDRMVALRDRRQMRQVIEVWQSLTDENVDIPDYALQAVADALLYLQCPQQAAELYAAIAQRNKNNPDAWLGLYYSLHESNQFDRATALIERLVEEQGPWDWTKGYRVPDENLVRFRFELAAALDRLYRNEHELAEQRLTALLHQGPRSSELRKAMGDLENGRRHPRRAQQLFEQGLAVEPENPGLQAALADSFMVRRQWRLAEKSIARLQELFPAEGSSLRLQDEWLRYNMRILEGRLSFGTGDGPEVDGQEIDWLLRAWTRPIDYDWRVAAFVWNRSGEFTEGSADRIYAGVAARQQIPDWELFAQFALADAKEAPWLLELSGKYELSDHWALRFALTHNGESVSLRALESGSGGREYLFGVEWWRNESLSASAQLALLDYTDGNLRTTSSAGLRKRLWSGPSLQLENVSRLVVTQNSRPGGAYFAPDSDLLLEDELQLRWITWRCYADTFTQRASVSTGGYWQQNFGWSVPFALSYAHEWELQQRRLFIEYGPSFSYRNYDGEAENNFGLYLAFSWRY